MNEWKNSKLKSRPWNSKIVCIVPKLLLFCYQSRWQSQIPLEICTRLFVYVCIKIESYIHKFQTFINLVDDAQCQNFDSQDSKIRFQIFKKSFMKVICITIILLPMTYYLFNFYTFYIDIRIWYILPRRPVVYPKNELKRMNFLEEYSVLGSNKICKKTFYVAELNDLAMHHICSQS